jgi:hypothetical protein
VKGRVIFEIDVGSSSSSIIAEAGHTVFISKGTRFRPSFPVGDTQCPSLAPSPPFDLKHSCQVRARLPPRLST